jgi:hypothetical protein
VGLFGAQFGTASLAFLWPNLRGGFGSVIELGVSPQDVRNQIDQDRETFYFGAGRLFIVKYEVDPVPEIYEGLVQDGLMALYQKCVHLGCRVPGWWVSPPCSSSEGMDGSRTGSRGSSIPSAPLGDGRHPVRGGPLRSSTIRADSGTALSVPDFVQSHVGHAGPKPISPSLWLSGDCGT